MRESADQLILEYLAVVADVAHRHLGSRERLDFMTRLRDRIEEHRGGSADPAKIRKVLARIGDAERLVLRERRRLDAARGAAATATDTAPGTGTDAAADTDAAAEGVAPGSAPERPRYGPPFPRTFGHPDGGPIGPPAGSSLESEPDDARADAADLGTLARRRPLEVGALGLLGLGGLLLPIPLWLFGAGLVGYSRMWTRRAKLIGVAGPLAVTGAGALWYARGDDGVVDAVSTATSTILRFAGLVGAIFLGVLLLRGAGVRSLRMRGRWHEP
jgi:hypothetical protein